MENFEFFNSTRILFGRATENKIGEILKKDRIKKVVFVYGKESIKKIGLYERVVKALKDNGIEFVEHSGVKPNPVLSHTREGIEKAKAEKVDAILAVGGGSVIDEGKTIAVGAKSKKDVWRFFKRQDEIKGALPVYTILTLAATGTEMNENAVITNEETKEKLSISSRYIYPRVSILNPELTFSVSATYQAYAAVDAIAHVIEYYFSGSYCPMIQNRFIEGLIKTVMDTTESILKEPYNYNARAEFMWAATLALNGLAKLGIKGGSFPNHMIAHALGGIYDLAHGACLSIVIPAWMKWYKDKNPAQFERFAREIFNKETADEGVSELKAWFKKIGAPVSLKDAGIEESHISKIVENAYNIAEVWQMNDVYTKEVLTEIIKNANY
ncbi:iron-containing alcohol dehydrogenase [Thermodesulfovibrio sp. 3907-1M]|uniref:Iron-containing alcohol dehydrogenase n=1 Tax=Thermodesulfovibrio autotrophicus TaxID=3118333 RepID=A0AAU8GT91_9BACT